MAAVKATYVNAVTVDADDTDVNVANLIALRAKAQTALANNATYLAISNPTTAQSVAQVAALTRQMNALIRLISNQLDTTTGT